MTIRTGSLQAVVCTTLVMLVGVAAASAQGEWQAPPEAKELKNPVQGVGNAKTVTEINCSSCHGSGKGDGPAAPALPVKPADWTSPGVQSQADGELYWKITNGRGVMPAWKHLSEKERWALVNYIRTLKP